MLDFITVPLITGIITFGIYKLFELFARRKERAAIIDKIGDKLSTEDLSKRLELPSFSSFKINLSSFTGLKLGLLLAGFGLGLLIGSIFSYLVYSDSGFQGDQWSRKELVGVIYGGSMFVCGGIGLVVAFIMEQNIREREYNRNLENKDKEKEEV